MEHAGMLAARNVCGVSIAMCSIIAHSVRPPNPSAFPQGEPLRRYFYGLYSQAELNAFEANMFLAEDRILCIEVVAKKGCNYRLEYIKEAVAEADAVTKLTGLMKQRRRWLNGTFFAMLYALGNMGRIWTESAHSVGRKVTLTLEFMYLTINLIFGTWFGIGIFYVLLYMLLKVAFDSEGWLVQIGNVVQLLYLFLIIVQLIINLKNKPEAVEKIHSFCAIYFCLYMLVFTGVSISFLITNTDYSFMGISTQKLALVVAILMSALGGILLTALLHGEILAVLGAGFQYWIMQPVFFNMLQMYAFCNADDISWGTKNLDTKHADHDAKKMASKALAYQVRPSKTSKAFWDAMSKVQNHLTDAKKIAAYNQKKEQKMRVRLGAGPFIWGGCMQQCCREVSKPSGHVVHRLLHAV
jgi:chitin synthase